MAGKSQKPVLVDQLALPAFRRLLPHEQQEIVLRARRIDAGQERPLVDFGHGTYALRGNESMGNPLVRFVVEENRLLAVVDPFAIDNTEELEKFTKRLIAEAIEERHRRGLSCPMLIEAEE